MIAKDFHFDLPPDRIAQHPASRRDESRLLVFHRDSGDLEHRVFRDLETLLRPEDLLILNDSRVIPARMHGFKVATRGAVEILLLEEVAPMRWWVMLRPGKRVRAGTEIQLWNRRMQPSELRATVLEKNSEGNCLLQFEGVSNLTATLSSLGELPLPPYVSRSRSECDTEDRIRYQTVYARHEGSVAAPTAGLHFTPELLEKLRQRGVEIRFLTLHVGHGTFAPVKTERIEDHRMHEERFTVPEETAEAWRRARAASRRIVAVGTTCVRVLEHVVRGSGGTLVSGSGRTRIFLHPPQVIRAADALLTNFHLPESTLLMLVSAFAAPGELDTGRLRILHAYREAVRLKYRFYSYGDAMLIT
ncbi:MAG: tRNA preQ1(34) S-adenosylmethionine ribosyltransferase-isomerase QueA [Verrucomicrobiales bacterium]|nr:tRNA preQ1(34) S-adenosylmethionine ribosyltransferase-isomerase QueA [Verrucomicrobiales bacterium]